MWEWTPRVLVGSILLLVHVAWVVNLVRRIRRGKSRSFDGFLLTGNSTWCALLTAGVISGWTSVFLSCYRAGHFFTNIIMTITVFLAVLVLYAVVELRLSR